MNPEPSKNDDGMAKLLGELTVEGRRYRVVENLGFQASAGVWAKVVVPAMFDGSDDRRTVVSRRRDQGWRFWTQEDRLR